MNTLPISTRLLLSYLLVAVLPLTGLSLFFLSKFETSVRTTVLGNMADIADKKSNQIDSFIFERLSDAKQLGHKQYIVDYAIQFDREFHRGGLDSPAYRAIEHNFREHLDQHYPEIAGYYDFLLIDNEGDVAFSMAHEADRGSNLKSGPYRSTQLAQGFGLVTETLQTRITSFEPYAPSRNRTAAFLMAPLRKNGVIVGVLALQVDLNKLEDVVTDRVGLGSSGETGLAQLDGSDVLYVAPLKHIADAAFKYRLPLQNAPQPMQQALAGNHARGIIRDYAGIECAAAWRYLPSLHWGMVVKMDTAEAMASANQLRNIVYLTLALFLLLSGVMAYLLGRKLSRPITSLTKVAEHIARGDLTQQIPVTGNDELGRLAIAFNHMTKALTNSRSDLEYQIEQRTQALMASSALQEAILDNAGALIIVLDREGRIRRFNRACEALTQYSFDEIEGQFVWDYFLPPEERDTVHKEAFEAATQNPTSVYSKYTNHWVARNGGKYLIDWSNTLLLDTSGKMEFMVSIGTDVTEKSRAALELKESEASLRDAQSTAQIGNWRLDLISGKLSWSDEIFNIFEVDQALFGASYDAFLAAIHPEDRDAVNAAYTNSLTTRAPYEILHRLLMQDGRVKWVNERCKTLYDEQGKALVSTGTVQDVTHLHESEAALRLYASAFEHSGEAILITDAKNLIVATNQAFTALTGYTQEEVQGQSPSMLSSGKTDKSVYEKMWHDLNSIGFWQGELWDKHKEGHMYPKWLSITAVRNDKNEVINYIASFADITEFKAAADKISHLAHHDTLTDLPNRFTLVERLTQSFSSAQRNNEKVAVMFIDLDRFKLINDTLGHHVGDQLLIEVANRLQACVRSSDIVARLGGDEFVVGLPELEGAEGVFQTADKILRSLGAAYSIEGNMLHSSPSIGIALFPADGASVEDVMKNADMAMYHAKSKGRNNYQFFEEAMNQASLERLELENDMRSAIEREEFVLHYQPKITIENGRVSGVEALVRWQHPTKGMISPAMFIPIAEETGLMVKLGEWVTRTACHQLHLWRKQGLLNLQMSINLSARQFRQKDLAQSIAAIVTKTDVDPAHVEFEITESMAMDNPQETIETMKILRSLGVKLAIDDFGTGYSSLSYLKRFPMNTLKLDRSFVKDIETDPSDAAICSATIGLAHNMGLEVVAEGVETEKQYEYLKKLGCDKIQGFYFCRPLPAAEAEAYIVATNNSELFETPTMLPASIMVVDDDVLIGDFLRHTLEYLGHYPTTETDPLLALEKLRADPTLFSLIMVDMLMPNMSGIDLIKAIRGLNRDIAIVVITSYKTDAVRTALRPIDKDYNLLYGINYFILEKPLTIEGISDITQKILA